MSTFPNSSVTRQWGAREMATFKFFNAVYAWMAVGLALTAGVAYWASMQPAVIKAMSGGLVWVLVIAELALVFTVSAAIQRISATTATLLFMLYAGLNGLTLSTILLIYTHSALASAFIVSAGTFGVMSVYGHVTRRDLSGLGSLLFMGLIGVILASVVSIFWHNTLLQVAINYIGVLVFVGLTAYDTQRLKAFAFQTSGNAALADRVAISGALMLYLDFINLFLFMVQIMSDRRR